MNLRIPDHPAARAALGLVALLVVGGTLVPQTLSTAVFAGMAPFAAVLGLASIGQHLVVQQRGFDLSVAGVISLSAVLATALAPGAIGTGGAVLLAILAGGLAGLANGLLVTRLGITPLVTTIGTNAVLLGLSLAVSGGVPSTAAPALTALVNATIGGFPLVALVLVVATASCALVLSRTTAGYRFVAVGVNPAAARALAIPVERYAIATYALASVFFACAGVVLAGFLVTPTVFSGGPYMLTTIAAVVVGGSPLNGDRGSVVATAIGALFLTYLDQLVLSLGFDASMQSVVQAVIILAGVGLPEIVKRMRMA
jgi:ribose/xylose/arabinose/galactoside ABC-type transport system permease subunit